MKLCKRLLSCLLVAAMLVANFPAVANAEGTTQGTYEGLIYEISDGEATITGYNSEPGALSKNLLIPETIEGCPVTGIGDNAFDGCGMTSVTIPDSVTGKRVGILLFLPPLWAIR